ncbi:hypothetical protein P389DRAFT_35665 [Cystobasidium minutum MCA 4210]|uniref:uncharacterized protein n=1 Tax=Cystobasidium minutum MCA 4210 TaxID=1397322 RepID=UPI0034CD7F06|eukprot:jgi/Rhomi1/35665/CE35664_384
MARLSMMQAGLVLALIACVQAERLVFAAFRNLVTARMDPIVSPGLISQHSHHILGGSNFKPRYDPDGVRKSKCNSFAMTADKSQYWHPQVFRILENGSYIGMDTGTRIYYEFYNYGPNGTAMEAFPYDFMMVGGDPARKSRDPDSVEDASMAYYCEQVAEDGSRYGWQTFELPTYPCNLLITKVFMPNCWNGKKYDPANPKAHMRYSYDWFDGPRCPKGFEHRVPSILIESFHFNADVPYHNNKEQYILANGDTTGYGLHGDMVNGWERGVLEGILKNCPVGTINVTEPVEQGCPFLEPYMDYEHWGGCRTENEIPAGPDEEVGWYNGTARPIDDLPGCNPPWASGPKPTCAPPQLAKTRGRVKLAPMRGPGLPAQHSLWFKPSPATAYP